MEIKKDFPFDFCQNCENMEVFVDSDCLTLNNREWPVRRIWSITVGCKHADICRKLRKDLLEEMKADKEV